MHTNKHILLLAVGCIATAVLARAESVIQPTPALSSPYQLAFSDEFNGHKVDTATWYFRADAKHRSAQSPENVMVEDGSLKLTLRTYEEPVRGMKAGGGGIITRERFRYGYYEVRARFGNGRDDDGDGQVDEGWHHSFWVMAAEGDDNGHVKTTYPGIRRTEIDCYEFADTYSADGVAMKQHVIVWNEDGSEWGRLPKPPEDLVHFENFDPTIWHTYGFEWTPEDIRFFVDGELTRQTKYSAEQFEHDSVNIWLTAISANWCDRDPEPSSAHYDYVRYFKPVKEAGQ
jgi:beta-glucanase (GH16 family)